MSVIKRLSENVINQIAAGEVVERPLSVVKELVDNAIDSGADRIKIEVLSGGQELIKVSDNGCGMDEVDLKLCFERHATSKLNESNLDYITNLGFRGEAIPSIASVACVTIDTKIKAAVSGLCLSVDGGVFGKVKPSAIMEGTCVEVRNLFCYTPARLKFLKSIKAEKAAILNLIQNYVLSYYNISFSLWFDGKEALASIASSSLDTKKLEQIFGSDIVSQVIPINQVIGDITLSGFIGLPNYNHASQQMMFSYVNKRIVKDKVINTAMKVAYQNLIPLGRYPFCILNIEIDPYEIDVNVHPAKTEIRFREPNRVRSVIINCIRNSIRAEELNVKVPVSQLSYPNAIYQTRTVVTPAYVANESYRPSYRTSSISQPNQVSLNEINEEEKISKNQPLGHALRQIDCTYIIAANEDNLILVDQHAAHERIVLESYKNNLAEAKVAVQMLLIPVIVNLPIVQIETLLAQKQEITKLGFEIDKFGINQLSISSCPIYFDQDEIASFIEYLAHFIEDHGADHIFEKYYTDILGNIACRMSIRAGRSLNIAEMNNLLRAIEGTSFSSECNHGRPTFKVLDKKQLAKMFERI